MALIMANNFSELYKKKIAHAQLPQWLSERKEQAWLKFNEQGFPTRRNEDWKYTNLSGLAKSTVELNDPSIDLDQDLLASYKQAQAINLVFVDGKWSPEMSDSLSSIQDHVKICSLAQACIDHADKVQELLKETDQVQQDALSDLNSAFLDQGCFISLDAQKQCPTTVHLIFFSTQSQDSQQDLKSQMIRNLIHLGRNAQLTLCETYVSCQKPEDLYLGGLQPYFKNQVTDIHLSEDATINHYKVQAEQIDAYHIGLSRVFQKKSSNYNAFSFSLGAKLSRSTVICYQLAEDTCSKFDGLYLGKKKQHTDNVTTIFHQFERGQSSQFYKGILDDEARGVFLGKVNVDQKAQKTAAKQLNKNILLSEGAEIDTKPQLEIDADDVKCAHGATVSQLRDEEIFYFQTRGINKEQARQFLCHAFADEALLHINHVEIRQYIKSFLNLYFKSETKDQ